MGEFTVSQGLVLNTLVLIFCVHPASFGNIISIGKMSEAFSRYLRPVMHRLLLIGVLMGISCSSGEGIQLFPFADRPDSLQPSQSSAFGQTRSYSYCVKNLTSHSVAPLKTKYQKLNDDEPPACVRLRDVTLVPIFDQTRSLPIPDHQALYSFLTRSTVFGRAPPRS